MFCESSGYSVFIMDRKADVRGELPKVYPYRFDECQVLAKRFAHQKIVAVRKTVPGDEAAEEFPVMFLMDRCRGFSGSVIFFSGMSCEKCTFEKGCLVSRCIVPAGTCADLVYLPAGIPADKADEIAGTGCRIKYYKPDKKYGCRRKTSLEFCVLFILVVAVVMIMAEITKKRIENERYDQIQMNEKVKAQKQKQEKLLLENCDRLRKEYLAIAKDKKISPYRVLQNISFCAGKGSIDSVSMDGKSFTLDASGLNVADIYRSFEKADSFYGVRLVRSSLEKNVWFFTVTGNFAFMEEVKNFSSVEEEISFYESQIALHEIMRSERKSVGETLGDILDASEAEKCSLLFMQTSVGEGKVFVDFSFSGKERNVLSFVKDISEKYYVHYMNVTSFDNVLTAVFKVDSGLEEGFEIEKEKTETDVEYISGDMFKKKITEKPRAIKKLSAVQEDEKLPLPENLVPGNTEIKVESVKRPVYSERNYMVIGTVVDAQGRSIKIVKDKVTNEIIQIEE